MRQNISPDVLDTAVQKANLWLKDVQRFGRLRGKAQAYSALRSVLHAIRDCLPAGAATRFSAQMPLLVKGVFFDGWHLSAKPRRLDRDAFVARLREALRGQEGLDPFLALESVVRALDLHLGRHELEKVQYILPRDVRALIRERIADLRKDQAVALTRDGAGEEARRRG